MDFAPYVESRRETINQKLAEYFEKKRKDLLELDSDVAEENYLAMRNYMLGKGKRLRSICVLLGYAACGGMKEETVFLPSLSVEFFHNASLILDDVMDEDLARREIPAAHALLSDWFTGKFGHAPYHGHLFSNAKSRFAVSMSTIATDMLFSLGAQTIFDSIFDSQKKLDALQVYEKTYRLVNLGQMLDVYYEHEKKIDTKKYLRMAYLKTGVLLGGALKIGGCLAGATPSQLKALDQFAEQAATTFQIQDDILDITLGAEKGRELGSDLRKGKTTILVLLAKEKLSGEDWKTVENVLGKERASQKEVEKAMKVLHERGIVKHVQDLAQKCNIDGKKALRKATPAFSKEHLSMLDALADYLMHRTK